MKNENCQVRHAAPVAAGIFHFRLLAIVAFCTTPTLSRDFPQNMLALEWPQLD